MKKIMFTLILAIIINVFFPIAGFGAPSSFQLSDAEQSYLASISDEPLTLAVTAKLYSFVTSDGVRTGLLGPFINLLEDSWGLQINTVNLGWDESFKKLDANEVDILGLAMMSEKRRDMYYCTEPIYRSNMDIYTRKDFSISNLIELEGKTIGLMSNSALPEMLEVYLTPAGKMKYYKTVDELIFALENKEIDCAATALAIQTELLSHPTVIYKTSVESIVVQQSIFSNNERLAPLMDILNRYLASPEGAKMIDEINSDHRKCVLEEYRDYYNNDIKYVRDNYDELRVFDNGSLYPLSFIEDGQYNGLQNELNNIFYELTGKRIEVLGYSAFPDGIASVVREIKNGTAVAAAGVYNINEYAGDEQLEYSKALMIDSLGFYVRQDSTAQSLDDMKIGSINVGNSYMDWKAVTQNSPIVFYNCADLIKSVKDRSVDAAFIGEMSTDYFYTVLNDYTLKRFGGTSIPASVHMLYGADNQSFNRLMDACIELSAMVTPDQAGPQPWTDNSQDAKFELMRLRDQVDKMQSRTVFAAIVLVAFLSFLLILVIYQLYKFSSFDKQISKMLSVQANADMIWGKIRTGELISKGDYPILKKLGMSIEDAADFIGIPVFKADMQKIEQQKLAFYQSDWSLGKTDSENIIYLRRFTHKISDNEFMAYIMDITAEKYRENELSRLADTDFLTRLLNRRAIDRILLEKSDGIASIPKKVFIYMFDIDNFKQVNDSYGHDIGDKVLTELAGCIQRSFATNCSARWGGEEFLSVADLDDEEQATSVAEILLAEFAAIKFSVGTRHVFSVTASCGVSELLSGEPYVSAIERADMAMYQAKCDGKNCVRFLPHDTDGTACDHAMPLSGQNRLAEDFRRQKSDYDYALMNARAFSWIQSVKNNTYVFTSDVKNILGYPDEFFDGTAEKVRSIIFPEDLPEADRSYIDFITGKVQVYSPVYRMVAADGNIVWLRFEARFVDEICDIISGVAFDISEQKRMELKQQLLLDDLQTQELKTSLAFESSRSFSWESIPSEDKLLLGKTAELALGYPPHYFNDTLSGYMGIMAYDYADYVNRKQLDYLNGVTDEYTTEYPLITSNGEIKWYLVRGTFADEKKGLLCGVCIDITDTKMYEQRLSELAYKDSLTGLYNMQYLTDGLISDSPALPGMYNLGAMLIDVKGFKNINDAFGYDYGDKLLSNISKNLIRIIPDKPIIRISGDRFLVLVGNTSVYELESCAQKIISDFNEPVLAGEQLIGVSFKIGIAIAGEADVIMLLRDAEIALYNAKNDDSTDFCVLDELMKTAFEKRVDMEFDLRWAIKRNEFVMYYQPKISTYDKELVGAEALIRWEHPELGIIQPLDFIPLAEETGLIVQIGEYVIDEVTRQLKEWLDEGRDISVSLNLSPRQFLSPQIKSQILGAVSRNHIPPNRLVLEITESIMISDFDYIKSLLNELHSSGVGISLDDFGTGYSSMNYLGKIPLDYLKIDKSFIKNATTVATDKAILESIITMSHKLNFKVIAEGVETSEHLAMLENFGCDIIQGFLFSAPLSRDKFEEFMDIVERYEPNL